MNKEDLLDAKSAFDVKLLECLFHNHGAIPKSRLIDTLQTTPRMITDHVVTLNDSLKMLPNASTAEIIESRTMIQLQMYPAISLEEITNHIIQESLAYRVLAYAFWNTDFTMQKMQQALLISESTLFRTMNKVNRLLQEFNISIRNNRINGREIDIRHFYFNLFSTLNALNPKLRQVSEPHIRQFIKDFETLIESPLTEISRNAINIYYSINLQRNKTQNLNIDIDAVDLDMLYENNYGRQLVGIFEKNLSIVFRDLDFEIINFILFISSERILPWDNELFKFIYHTGALSPYLTTIRSVVAEIVDFISIKFNFSGHFNFLRYVLYYEIGNIILFPGVFSGLKQLIYTAMQGDFWQEDSGQIQFCNCLIQKLQKIDPVFKSADVVSFLKDFFTMILLLLLNKTCKVFRIGFYDMHEQAINYYLRSGLATLLKASFNVEVSAFTKGQKYDVILTTTNGYDQRLLHDAVADDQQILEVKDFGAPEDIAQVMHALDHCVSEYLKRDLDIYA